MVAPAQQRNQVISTSEYPRARSPRRTFFPQKSWPFLVVALKTQRPPTPLRLFHCQNKTKRSDILLFSVDSITEAKQSNRQGGARAVDLPARMRRPGVAPPLVMSASRLVAGSSFLWCKHYTNWDRKWGISLCCLKLCFHSCAFCSHHLTKQQDTRQLSAGCHGR